MASAFHENELTVTGTRPSLFQDRAPERIYGNRPISGRENIRRLFAGAPMWLPISKDMVNFCPLVLPDNVARGYVSGGEAFDPATQGGGKDMFGVEWIYLPQQGGSMVRPGNPLLTDANDWETHLRFPDVSGWDWAGSRRANAEFLRQQSDRWISFPLLSGAWFERLVSFMDFEGAAVALIDEEQSDAVHALFSATTDLLIRIVDQALETFPEICAFYVHDDWGSQTAPLFSQTTAMEMIVPHMRSLVEHIHAAGRIAELHSCGRSEDRIEAYIAAGWDSWCPQTMNDHAALFRNHGAHIVIDKVIVGVSKLDEAQQKAFAHECVEAFVQKDRFTRLILPFEDAPVFEEEVYRLSRIAYAALSDRPQP